MNHDLPGDRWRYALCHELGHLVMHDARHERMQDEADAFAAEFLTPESEMRAQFSRCGRLRLQDFGDWKQYWKVSIGALIERAHDLGFLNIGQRRDMWTTMGKLGYGVREPNPIQAEESATFMKIAHRLVNNLEYGPTDLGSDLKLDPPGPGSLRARG